MLVKDIMTTNVITVNKNATIEEIVKILIHNNISGVPVVDDNGKLVGIVTEKDLIYKDIEPKFPACVEFLGGMFFVEGIKNYEEKLKKFLANKAEDIMTSEVVTITEDMDVKEVAEIMVEKGVKRLPVLKDEKVIGIVSRSDVVRSLIL